MKQNKFLTSKFEVKNLDTTTGEIEGYASTFGNIDLGLDIVDAGAFRKTLSENQGKVPILADHNPYKQIGWNLEAREDERGLHVRGMLDIENNAMARERFSLVRKAFEIGAKSGLSIGFMTIKEEPDMDKPAIRHIKEVKLFEYSLVTFPMNQEAAVTAAKHWLDAGEKDLDGVVGNLVETLRDGGYSEKEIQIALAKRAAGPEVDPDEELQSLQHLLDGMKRAFA